MKQLTLKTVALVALTSAQRSQTLAALDVNVMKSDENGSEFIVKENRLLWFLCQPFQKLCVHSTLSCYVDKISNVRQAVGTSKLFLSNI